MTDRPKETLNTGGGSVPVSLRDRIAAVQAQHHHWDYAGALTCACGADFGLNSDDGWEHAVQDWAQHVADAVIAALEQHWREGNPTPWSRQVEITKWGDDE